MSEEKAKNFCEKIHLVEPKETKTIQEANETTGTAMKTITTRFKEIKKEAELNEYIKIIDPIESHGAYKKGDVFKVIFKSDSSKTKGYVKVDKIPNPILHQEYIVLKNHKGE